MCTPDVAMPCHAMPGRDVPCPRTFAPSAPLARELLSCPVSQPHNSYLPNRTSESLLASHHFPDALSILSLLAFHHSPSALSIPLSFLHRPSPILATFPSQACVLKRFPLTSPPKIAPDVRETGLFTHGRASLNFTIIHMFTSDVAMPCLCGAWQGCAMPPHLRPAAMHLHQAFTFSSF